ncbi:MAG: DUF885 domain-containing protein [Erysipelotrichaceae bacterium]|nr:DUF885 domain-containing protein [Erysipelotrichaceae bacterium]
MRKILLCFIVIFLVSCQNKIIISEEFNGNYEFEKFLDKQYYGEEKTDSKFPSKNDTYIPYFNPKEYTLENYAEVVKGLQNTLNQLETFDISTMNNSQYYTYLTYKDYINQQIFEYSNPYFDSLFSSTGGVIDYVISTFVDYDFSYNDSIDLYIKQLTEVKDYLDSAISFSKLQAEKGYALTDSEIDVARSEIYNFISKVEDNVLITTFENNINENENKKLDEVKEIVINEVLPAFKKVYDSLNDLKGYRKIEGGIAKFDNGREYYEQYLKYSTGIDKNLDEFYEFGYNKLLDLLEEIHNFYDENPDFVPKGYTGSLKDPEEIIEFFKSKYTSDMSKGPDVSYIVEYLDKSVADEGTLAYYSHPDFQYYYEDNLVKINPYIDDYLRLISTLAHEAYPGHLHQFTYFYSLNPHPIRSTFSNDGYAEGWAVYSEYNSLKYLDDLEENERKFYVLDDKINMIITALIDIGVNGYGWSKADTYDELSEIIYEEDVEGYYLHVCDNPFSMSSYAFGMLYMYDLLEKTKNELGDKFNIKEFNDLILNNGPRSFKIIENDLEIYIKNVKGE